MLGLLQAGLVRVLAADPKVMELAYGRPIFDTYGQYAADPAAIVAMLEGAVTDMQARAGTPVDPRDDFREFRKLLARAGLPPVRLHDLRHTAASLLLAQNVPARVVMEILGHSQIALTMNTYSHVAPEVSREAAERMARMLWQSAEDDEAEVLEDAE
jgi:site-specific recombinase XerC